MKYLFQHDTHRAVIGIGRHQIAHVSPPPLAYVRRRDGTPLLFAFELDVAEQMIGGGIEKDRVRAHAVLEERALEILPDGLMPADVLSLLTGMDRHAKRFAHRRDYKSVRCSILPVLSPMVSCWTPTRSRTVRNRLVSGVPFG